MTDPNAYPGRRLTQARRRRQKLAVADLLAERFSRLSTESWWPTPPTQVDAEIVLYRRRSELEAVGQDEKEGE